MMHGFVDVISTRHVEGWAIGKDNSAPILNVFVNCKFVASTTPNIRRSDLDAFAKDSHHGFRVDFPVPVPWGSMIEVKDAEGNHLSKSPAQLAAPDNAWLNDAPNARSFLSYSFLKGEGLEIGALDRPLPVAPGVKVRFVDRMVAADLVKEYAEIRSSMVKVDIVSDGQTLRGIEDGRYDFVIANHVIEHMEDPTLAVKNYLRVLKSGGTIFMAVPDKRKTFDVRRPLTDIPHLLSDHDNGPASSRDQHYIEWASLVEGNPNANARAKQLNADDYSIHFHTWDVFTFPAYLEAIRKKYSLPLDIRMIYPVGIEVIAILQKA
jgi:predicted SAM-dependent methyltransferase